MNIYEITFSPTGGTGRIAQQLVSGISSTATRIDLCSRRPSSHEFTGEDLCVVSVPSFAGRVPALAAERIGLLSGNQARAVAVVSYGNRAYDDTVLELKNLLTQQGFRVIAAVAAIAEHSILRQYAAGRPDAADLAELLNFGRQIARAAAGSATAELNVPGNVPYRPLPASGVKPSVSDRCASCGTCAAACPAGAIPEDAPSSLNAEKCISCMRCISVCPVHARFLPPELLDGLNQRIGPALSGRKQNELFL